MSVQNCPICGDGTLIQKVEKTEFTINYTAKFELDSYYHACDACGSEVANADDTQRNKRLMDDAKRKHFPEVYSPVKLIYGSE